MTDNTFMISIEALLCPVLNKWVKENMVRAYVLEGHIELRDNIHHSDYLEYFKVSLSRRHYLGFFYESWTIYEKGVVYNTFPEGEELWISKELAKNWDEDAFRSWWYAKQINKGS